MSILKLVSPSTSAAVISKVILVEALQCLKCSIHNDLLFHVAPTSTVELDGEDEPECRDSDPVMIQHTHLGILC